MLLCHLWKVAGMANPTEGEKKGANEKKRKKALIVNIKKERVIKKVLKVWN